MCGIYVSANHSGGRIIANGTASAPLVFTSAQATPTPGDWAGITVNSDSMTADFGATSFAYGTFSYATATTFGSTPGSSELYFDGFAACLPSGGGPGTAGPPVTHCAFTNLRRLRRRRARPAQRGYDLRRWHDRDQREHLHARIREYGRRLHADQLLRRL
jgi:hypothetical protein